MSQSKLVTRLLSIAYPILIPLLLTSFAFAGKHAPLPDSMLRAKTIYLVNRTGQQAVVDNAYQQFQKWGRFTVVGDENAADLIAVFSSGWDRLSAGTSHMAVSMAVSAKGSEDASFETTERVNIFSSAAKRCVEDFESRLK